MRINSFEELECWKLARELCSTVYEITKRDPFCKDFKHVDQINNSSGSAMDNIAEGYGRNGNKEFINFLSISLGSSNECKSQIIRAFDKKFISNSEFEELKALSEKTIASTGSFMNYLIRSDYKGSKFK